MAQLHWLSAVNADFGTAADWTSGRVPGSGDDAILDATGSAFTVTVSAAETVSSIQTAANATLSITTGSLTAANGSGGGANAGTIAIGDNTTLTLGGTVANSGFVELESAGDATTLLISGATTFTGAGKIGLSDNGANTIDAAASGATLVNNGNNIHGVGQIGSANLAVVNEGGGIIKANGVLPLVLTGVGVTNDSGIKAAIDSNMILSNVTVKNAAGVIKAKDGASVSLQSAHIEGGKLATIASGVIETTDTGSLLDGSASSVTNSGELSVNDNTALGIEGAISNAGTIALASNLGTADLTLFANTTLSGGGHLTMSDSIGNVVGGTAGLVLDNVDDIISGSGNLGNAAIGVINGTSGVIDGTSASNTLVLNTGTGTLANSGLIEATGGSRSGNTLTGGLKIGSAIVNTGVIEANGGLMNVAAAVSGTGAVTIVAGEAYFKLALAQNVSFTGTSGRLTLKDSQQFTGSVSGFSHTGATSFDLGDIGFVRSNEASYSGNASGGTLTVSDGTHTARITLVGDYTTASFVCSSDGVGGTIVIDPTAPGASAFAQLAAALGADSAAAHRGAVAWAPERVPSLSRPHPAA